MLWNATQGWKWTGVTVLALAAFATLQGCAKKATPTGSGTGMTSGAQPVPPPTGTPTELYVRGAKAYDGKNYPLAVSDLKAAVDADPKFLMARERLGDVYKDQSDYPKAIEQYSAVVEADPADAGNWYKLGVAYHLSGKFANAVEAYEKASSLDPKAWKAKSNIGMIRSAEGKNEEAVTLTGAAKDLAADQADAWTNYGVALDKAGKVPEAEAAYRKSLELSPNQPAVQSNLGANLVAQNRGADAVPFLDQAAKGDPSAFSERILGDALRADKKYPEAETHYLGALKFDARHYQALNGLAEIKLAQGNKAEAVSIWSKSLAIKADQPVVLAAMKANQ